MDKLYEDEFYLDELSNEQLNNSLYKEFLFYDEDLYKLAKIIRKQLPKKMVFRLISKLYRIRNNGSEK